MVLPVDFRKGAASLMAPVRDAGLDQYCALRVPVEAARTVFTLSGATVKLAEKYQWCASLNVPPGFGQQARLSRMYNVVAKYSSKIYNTIRMECTAKSKKISLHCSICDVDQKCDA
ncbi:hypothetical protein [Sinorhizobium prairiense]|uniref:hypothetical protein n=1 Tax=unclassified Sinorhizobium TaxID=2613772 RepID=UPI0023D83C84|nr:MULTISPECIES: hypothetical protein [unclassified Sinorhizobium]WEJ08577.1 hypothetical protein N0Q90_02745 [Sinorhizobium sp. M103]WEJ13920.1 hypothetical protein N0Q91_02665 [Sinorhizobium sp. K101]WEJ35521.1 hypothetical protein N0R80_02700 [Sinorhizobium sp. C101]